LLCSSHLIEDQNYPTSHGILQVKHGWAESPEFSLSYDPSMNMIGPEMRLYLNKS